MTLLQHIQRIAAGTMYLGGGSALLGGGLWVASIFFPPLMTVAIPVMAGGMATGFLSAGVHGIASGISGQQAPQDPNSVTLDLPKEDGK